MNTKKLRVLAALILGLAAPVLAQNVPTYVPTNGLVGWWPFNGNANDESGNGNNGALSSNVTPTTNRNNLVNSALFFGLTSSSNNGVQIPSTTLLNIGTGLNKQFTISMWYYNDSLVGGGLFGQTGNLIKKPLNGNSSAVDYGILLESNQFIWGTGPSTVAGGDACAWNPVNAPAMHVWNHIVVTLNQNVNSHSGEKKVYFNGNLINSCQYGFKNNSNSDPLNIGVNGYIGKIDDLGIWNRALSDIEVQGLYNSVVCSNNTSLGLQPSSLTTTINATLSASTSDPNPIYLWQSDFGLGFQNLFNAGSYSGATTSSLQVTNLQLRNHLQPIRVITTSGSCIDTSNLVILSLSDTCLASVTDTLIINTSLTGVNPPNNTNTIKIFPNPANDHITIHYGNVALMSGYQLRIQNSLGQQVFSTNINQPSSYLSLANWGGNGLYFVHLIDPQGNTLDIRKIVLQ